MDVIHRAELGPDKLGAVDPYLVAHIHYRVGGQPGILGREALYLAAQATQFVGHVVALGSDLLEVALQAAYGASLVMEMLVQFLAEELGKSVFSTTRK